jgi:hypothetical protein
MIIRSFLTIAFVLIATSAAFACSCVSMGEGVCQLYWNTPAVFSGRVVQIDPIPRGTDENAFMSKRVRFAVIDAYRGVTGETAEVLTGSGGGDCGYNFTLNESYLVYAWSNGGKLSTGICSPTKLLVQAGEDMSYIRGLAEAKPGGSIYGNVVQYLVRKADDEYKPNPPMPDVSISIEGAKAKIETTTDAEGKFRVDGLPAGKYTVRATAPPGFYDRGTKIDTQLFDKGCAVAWFAFEVNTSLSGRVTDENSQPARIMVDLMPVEMIDEKYQKNNYYVESDVEGRFTFRTVPDGKYYLGVRLGRYFLPDFAYPKTFYPGTPDIARATVVEINEGVALKNYDFQLPPKLPTRTISGKVVLPAGTAGKDAYICFEESLGSTCEGDGAVKPDGSFKFTRFAGIKYILNAYANTPNGQRQAKPVTIPEFGNVRGLKVVINSATREKAP